MSFKIFGWLIVAATLALNTGAALAADHAHEHEGHGAAGPSLNHGQKWPTDALLRQGMESIRAALLPQLHAIRENKLKAAQYQALAQQTNKQIGYMVANCKLPPDADAQFHLIIGDLGAAAQAMTGNDKKQSRQEGAMRLQHVLETYGEFFDHPGWQVPGDGD